MLQPNFTWLQNTFVGHNAMLVRFLLTKNMLSYTFPLKDNMEPQTSQTDFVPFKNDGTSFILKHQNKHVRKQNNKHTTHTGNTDTDTQQMLRFPTGGQTQIWKLGPDCCWDVGTLPTAGMAEQIAGAVFARKREGLVHCVHIYIYMYI